jgi:hypothetical protein
MKIRSVCFLLCASRNVNSSKARPSSLGRNRVSNNVSCGTHGRCATQASQERAVGRRTLAAA